MSESVTVACPHCLAGNRFPMEKLEQQPHCGKCQQPLFTANALDVDEAAFSAHLRLSSLPIVVDLWAPWCGPCKAMAPGFQAAAARLEPQFRLLKVNTEAHQQLAAQFQIQSIPTIMLFQDGQLLARQSGAMNTGQLMQWLAGLAQ